MNGLSEQALSTLILCVLRMPNRVLQRAAAVLCMNPRYCYKLIDALTFLLQLDEDDFKALRTHQHAFGRLLPTEGKFEDGLRALLEHLLVEC